MVIYMSLMELVKAETMFPRLMRKPPIITTGRWPKRLLSSVDKGAEVGLKDETVSSTTPLVSLASYLCLNK